MPISWKNKSLHVTEENRFNVEGGYIEDSMFVSGPGSDTSFGGLYYVKRSGWMGGAEVWCVDRLSTRGVDVNNDFAVRSIQSDGFMVVTVYSDTNAKTTVSDKGANIHDLRILDGKIYAASTGTNEVLQLNADGGVVKTWTFGSGKDSWHINGIDIWDGRLVASAFGRFDGEGAYEGKTKGAGIVFDVETKADVWTGLSGPMTPRSDKQGNKYICDSGANRLAIKLKNGGEKVVEFKNAFPRGLAVGKNSVYVGLNFIQGQTGSCKIALLDPAENYAQTGEIELDIPEIYDIVVVD